MIKQIIDVCCGSKMFWFDKNNTKTIYADKRKESHELCDGRKLEINPDIEMDFRNIPYADETFKLVVFDPPHFVQLGKTSWMAKKYGVLNNTWKDDIKQGFSECFRILQPDGILVFKWNDYQVPLKDILKLTEQQPLFGNKRPSQSKTHWVLFMKDNHAPD